MQGEGAHTRMTADGASTLAALAEGPWDLVLLDARMPPPEGLEVLERIRRGLTGVAPDQLVILYTAALDAADRERCRRLRPDGILLKPVSFARLRAALENLLRQNSGKNPARAESAVKPPLEEEHVSEVGSAPNAIPVWDRAAALAAMDNDQALLEQLLAVLRADLREMAARLRAALAAGEAMPIRRLAHSCKNSAAPCGLRVCNRRRPERKKPGRKSGGCGADLQEPCARRWLCWTRLSMEKQEATWAGLKPRGKERNGMGRHQQAKEGEHNGAHTGGRR